MAEFRFDISSIMLPILSVQSALSLSVLFSRATGADGRILAMFTPIGNNTLNITIENDVYAGTQPREMDVIIRKGGINAPTQFDVVGTFDWPDQRFHLLHDLTPNTMYGIKLMRFEKFTGALEDSLSGSVYIPFEGKRISNGCISYYFIVFLIRTVNEVVVRQSLNPLKLYSTKSPSKP